MNPQQSEYRPPRAIPIAIDPTSALGVIAKPQENRFVRPARQPRDALDGTFALLPRKTLRTHAVALVAPPLIRDRRTRVEEAHDRVNLPSTLPNRQHALRGVSDPVVVLPPGDVQLLDDRAARRWKREEPMALDRCTVRPVLVVRREAPTMTGENDAPGTATDDLAVCRTRADGHKHEARMRRGVTPTAVPQR
jgi:hypothetical protein